MTAGARLPRHQVPSASGAACARLGGRAEWTDETLTIDIVSDVVCPWCYLGEKRLEAAIAYESEPVAVRWRPYQLDPTIPEGGSTGPNTWRGNSAATDI